MLESLQEVAGIHSFVLAVDPGDSRNEGFLGGTVLGREFWRGLRGGGDAGARTFKARCLKGIAVVKSDAPSDLTMDPATATSLKRGPASSMKAEVYANVRNALRFNISF